MGPSRFLALSRILHCALLLDVSGMQIAAAQSDPSTDPRFAEAAERARIEGDKVFKRILINGVLPKRAGQAAAEAAPAAPARPAAAKRPAPSLPNRSEPRAQPRQQAEHADGQARNAGPSEPSVGQASATPPSLPASAQPPEVPTAVPRAVAAEARGDTSDGSTAAAAPATEPEEDQPLILLHQVDPDFPAAIVRRQKKGAVVVRFEVQVDGSVKQPEVIRSSNSRLNSAALTAVAQWRFEPLSRPQSASTELAFDLHQAFDE